MKWVLLWAVNYACWLAYAAKASLEELTVGAAAAVAGTLAVWVFQRLHQVRFRPRLRALAEAWRLPGYLLDGTWKLLRALALQLITRQGAPSLLRAVRFQIGGRSAVAVARRALAITYTTSTPNSIVLGLVPRQHLLIYHQVLPSELSQLTRNLGAKP